MPKSICNCYYWAILKFSLVAWPVGASEGLSVCSFLWNGLKISTGGHKFLCITLWLWQICRKKLTLFLLQNAPPRWPDTYLDTCDRTRRKPAQTERWASSPPTAPDTGVAPRPQSHRVWLILGETVVHEVWRFSLIYFSGWNWVEDKNKSSKQNKKIKPR